MVRIEKRQSGGFHANVIIRHSDVIIRQRVGATRRPMTGSGG
jgi:hypothetical protein